MSVPVELVQLQQYLWDQVQNLVQREQTISAVTAVLVDLARGVWLPLVVGLLLVPLLVALYQPRIPRGALWVPVFGILGGAPRFYTHTRPASFCGFLLRSRHRVTTHHRRKS